MHCLLKTTFEKFPWIYFNNSFFLKDTKQDRIVVLQQFRDFWRSSCPIPLCGQFRSDCWGPVQLHFDYVYKWRLLIFIGQPLTVFDLLNHESSVFPCVCWGFPCCSLYLLVFMWLLSTSEMSLTPPFMYLSLGSLKTARSFPLTLITSFSLFLFHTHSHKHRHTCKSMYFFLMDMPSIRKPDSDLKGTIPVPGTENF